MGEAILYIRVLGDGQKFGISHGLLIAARPEWRQVKNEVNVMILFIPNIPANTKGAELYNFVDSALQSGIIFHSRLGKIAKLEELCIRDKATDHIEYHGLVYVDTYKAGSSAIKKLYGKIFDNTEIKVREYVTRMQENDRRLSQGETPPDILDRRLAERRRNASQKDVFKRNFP